MSNVEEKLRLCGPLNSQSFYGRVVTCDVTILIIVILPHSNIKFKFIYTIM